MNLNTIDLQKTLCEATIIGIITSIIGSVLFYLTKKENINDNKKNNDNLNYIIFFIIGFFLHFIIEIIGINQWYCDKQCVIRIKKLINL